MTVAADVVVMLVAVGAVAVAFGMGVNDGSAVIRDVMSAATITTTNAAAIASATSTEVGGSAGRTVGGSAGAVAVALSWRSAMSN